MQRIPIRIFQLADSGENSINEGRNILLNEWDYITGKTENDIDKSVANIATGVIGKITLTSDNIYDATFDDTKILDVYENTSDTGNKLVDFNGNTASQYFIYFDGKTYFIRNTQEPTTNDAIPNMFEFYINPERITPTYAKIITETKTRGGWDVQHWGTKLTEIRVEGRTGGLNKPDPNFIGPQPKILRNKDSDITQSVAWKRLQQLKAIYDNDHSAVNAVKNGVVKKLGFNYYDNFYIGYFSDFTGPIAEADKPYIMTYSFTFKVEQEIQFGSSIQALKGI